MPDSPKSERPTLQAGKKTFEPRARLVSVLGEQLIRDATVGLLELVKNSYDADASRVDVRISGTRTLESTQVVVVDDGYGMDRETILTRWFEPATGEKEQQKLRGIRTPRFKRLPLGEKGVGRFAAHRIGRSLVLVSRVEGGSTEVVVTVDWDDFDARDKYLHDVAINWEERDPATFQGDRHGTYLLMKRARAAWTESDIKKLSGGLRRLVSPFRPPEDFKVTLSCSDYAKYEDLDPGDLLKRSHSEFYGIVDETGSLDFEYKFTLPSLPARQAHDVIDLRTTLEKADWGEAKRKPSCGPFWVRFHLWHRTQGLLQLTGTTRADLDAAVGVSIFRDGMRVLPYGEPEDDWLGLDEERYMRPTEAVGRKTIVGAVEVSQEANRDLKDKTNREGLIENGAFRDLRMLVKAIVTGVLEKEWSQDKDVIQGEKEKVRHQGTRPALDALATEATRLEETSRTPLQLITELEESVRTGQLNPGLTTRLSEALSELSAQVPRLKEAAATSADTLEAAIDDLEHERDLLLGLAGLGLAAERFTHEFARLTREAYQILVRIEKRLKEGAPELSSDLDALRAIIDALRNDIKALGPMFYVRRATREKTLSVRSAVENARILNASALEDGHILFEVDCPNDFTVVMREGPLTQVFNNLIDNAAFWLGRKSEESDRRLTVLVDASKREVIVTDNGPGVFPRYKDRIFRPFFSMKTDGRGLGLYIAREILAEKGAELSLLEAGDHPAMLSKGASFRIKFPEESSGSA